VYRHYLRDDKKKWGKLSKDFMTFEVYLEIIKQNCIWCGRTPNEANGIGIDRKDNRFGHVIGNIEPCCWRCNRMRGELTVEEFKLAVTECWRNTCLAGN
jgi:hypothetical protein